MQKWEYQIIALIRYDQCEDIHEWFSRNAKLMNDFGDVGWELVETWVDTPPDDLLDNSIVPDGSYGEHRFALMKRPIEDNPV